MEGRRRGNPQPYPECDAGEHSRGPPGERVGAGHPLRGLPSSDAPISPGSQRSLSKQVGGNGF